MVNIQHLRKNLSIINENCCTNLSVRKRLMVRCIISTTNTSPAETKLTQKQSSEISVGTTAEWRPKGDEIRSVAELDRRPKPTSI
jgi:hypothetical protein